MQNLFAIFTVQEGLLYKHVIDDVVNVLTVRVSLLKITASDNHNSWHWRGGAALDGATLHSCNATLSGGNVNKKATVSGDTPFQLPSCIVNVLKFQKFDLKMNIKNIDDPI